MVVRVDKKKTKTYECWFAMELSFAIEFIFYGVFILVIVLFSVFFNQKIDTHGRLESVYNVYNEIVEIKKPLKNRLRAVNR